MARHSHMEKVMGAEAAVGPGAPYAARAQARTVSPVLPPASVLTSQVGRIEVLLVARVCVWASTYGILAFEARLAGSWGQSVSAPVEAPQPGRVLARPHRPSA